MDESKQAPKASEACDQVQAVLAKKIRALQKKLKRIAGIEAAVAKGIACNPQQADLLSKKPQLVLSLSEHTALSTQFTAIRKDVVSKEKAAERAARAAAKAAAEAAEEAAAAAAAAEAEAVVDDVVVELVDSAVATTEQEPAVRKPTADEIIAIEAVANTALLVLINVASHCSKDDAGVRGSIARFADIVHGQGAEGEAEGLAAGLLRAKEATGLYVMQSEAEAVDGISYKDIRVAVNATLKEITAPASAQAAAEAEEEGAAEGQGESAEINFFAADAPAAEAEPAAAAPAAETEAEASTSAKETAPAADAAAPAAAAGAQGKPAAAAAAAAAGGKPAGRGRSNRSRGRNGRGRKPREGGAGKTGNAGNAGNAGNSARRGPRGRSGNGRAAADGAVAATSGEGQVQGKAGDGQAVAGPAAAAAPRRNRSRGGQGAGKRPSKRETGRKGDNAWQNKSDPRQRRVTRTSTKFTGPRRGGRPQGNGGNAGNSSPAANRG